MIERNSVTVTLHDVDPTALCQLIDYAYTGEITISEDNVQVTIIHSFLNNSTHCFSLLRQVGEKNVSQRVVSFSSHLIRASQHLSTFYDFYTRLLFTIFLLLFYFSLVDLCRFSCLHRAYFKFTPYAKHAVNSCCDNFIHLIVWALGVSQVCYNAKSLTT